MGEKLWLEPEYFGNFSCKCGSCRHTCCSVWKIAVTEKEYYRLIGLDCSQELHEKLESAFATPKMPTKERFRMIEPDWRGVCRMLGSDGLCMLQKECGEEQLPEVCRVYPRSYRSENEKLQAVCSASCEAVIEQLIKADKIRLITVEMHAKPEIIGKAAEDFEKKVKANIDLIQNRERTVAERLMLICNSAGYSETDESEEITLQGIIDIISAIACECENIRPYITTLYDRAENIIGDFKKMQEHFPDLEIWIENFICNNIIFSDFPYVDERISEKAACCGLCLQYIILRLVLSAFLNSNGMSVENFVDTAAAVYHLVEHTAFYYNASVIIKNPLKLLEKLLTYYE